MIAQCFIRERLERVFVHHTERIERHLFCRASGVAVASTVSFSSWRLSSESSKHEFTIAFCSDFLDNTHLNNARAHDVYSANQIWELKSASTFQKNWCQNYFCATAPLRTLFPKPVIIICIHKNNWCCHYSPGSPPSFHSAGCIAS